LASDGRNTPRTLSTAGLIAFLQSSRAAQIERLSIDQKNHGDLEGTSSGQMRPSGMKGIPVATWRSKE
jgi:hypothetical protein